MKLTKFEINRDRKKLIIKIVNICLWIFGVFIIILCANNIVQRWLNPSGYTGLFGIGEAIVPSNSMEPKINQGDLIFYRGADFSDVSVGDTVIYKKMTKDGPILIIHDIINISGNTVVTQGVNNAVADDPFDGKNIVGKYFARIPKMGTLLSFMADPWVVLLIVTLAVIACGTKLLARKIIINKTIEKISIDNTTRQAIKSFFEL